MFICHLYDIPEKQSHRIRGEISICDQFGAIEHLTAGQLEKIFEGATHFWWCIYDVIHSSKHIELSITKI